MTKKMHRTLSLKKETLRRLDLADLRRVVGGYACTDTTSCSGAGARSDGCGSTDTITRADEPIKLP